jgi:hypothetical protein
MRIGSRVEIRVLKLFTSGTIPLSALLLLGMAGCETAGPQPQQDELQALLHDEPLTSLKGSSLSINSTRQTAAPNASAPAGAAAAVAPMAAAVAATAASVAATAAAVAATAAAVAATAASATAA